MMKPSSKGEAPVKLVIVLIVLVVVAGVVVALQPWNWSKPGGTVRFYSRAYFYLIGTEDNGPLENVLILLPVPNVDNKLLEPVETYSEGAFWTLYAHVDNELVIEVDYGEVKQLVNPRSSSIEMYQIGFGPSSWGPKFGFYVDNLYPGELVEVRQIWEVPADKANMLALRDTGPYSPAAYIDPTPVKKIDASFFAGLYKISNDNALQKVEEFQETDYNALTQVWWGLAPI